MFLIWLQEKINQKFEWKICRENVNEKLMKENIAQSRRIMINVDASIKKHHICEKDYVGILLHVVMKMKNI